MTNTNSELINNLEKAIKYNIAEKLTNKIKHINKNIQENQEKLKDIEEDVNYDRHYKHSLVRHINNLNAQIEILDECIEEMGFDPKILLAVK